MLDAANPDERPLLMLSDGDFPDHYRQGLHPDGDLEARAAPVPAECIFHCGALGHTRLLWRVGWRLPDGRTLPLTFVCDTGAPLALYLSRRAVQRFREHGLLGTDECGSSFVVLRGRRYRVAETPASHEPGNILGLPLRMDLGLRLDAARRTFALDTDTADGGLHA